MPNKPTEEKKLNLIGDYSFAFTSEKGFDFFIDKDLTDYARKSRLGLKKLLGFTVYVIAKDGEAVDRVLVNKKGEMIKNSTNLEEMACYVDALRKSLERN